MSTDVHADPAHPHEREPVEDHGHGLSDLKYVQVAAILAFITALEVAASYTDWLGSAFIPVLLILMTIKFAMVVLFFMHLKFDSPIFSWLFYSGLFLAVGVYVATLLTFHFFNP
jgi:cytochrome c oxidase subunit 4